MGSLRVLGDGLSEGLWGFGWVWGLGLRLRIKGLG